MSLLEAFADARLRFVEESRRVDPSVVAVADSLCASARDLLANRGVDLRDPRDAALVWLVTSLCYDYAAVLGVRDLDGIFGALIGAACMAGPAELLS